MRETFNTKVKPKNIENKEEIIRNHINGVQLYYCIRLFEGKIPFINGLFNKQKSEALFREIFLKYSDIESEILFSYSQRVGKVIDASTWKDISDYKNKDKNFMEFEDRVLKKIFSSYNSEPIKTFDGLNTWLKNIDKVIETESSNLPKADIVKMAEFERQIQDLKNKKEQHLKERTSGLLNFDLTKLNNIPDELKDYGLREGTIALKLHLKSIFEQSIEKGKDIKHLFPMESIKKLALDISKKYPEVKVIVADSWIMDTPLAKRAGFHILDRKYSLDSDQFHGDKFWGQFVSKDGELKSNKVSELLKTGKPPYLSRSGYITIAELKRKYLS